MAQAHGAQRRIPNRTARDLAKKYRLTSIGTAWVKHTDNGDVWIAKTGDEWSARVRNEAGWSTIATAPTMTEICKEVAA